MLLLACFAAFGSIQIARADGNGQIQPPHAPDTLAQSSGAADGVKQDSDTSFFDSIAKHVSIRNSFLEDSEQAKPATFSWTKAKGNVSYYSVDAAVQLNVPSFFPSNSFFGEHHLQIQPLFEAHVSSDTNNAQDSLSARLPISMTFLKNDTGFVKRWYLTVSPVYEFDRLNDNETIGGDLFVTPNIPRIGIGKWWPGPDVNTLENPTVAFHWRPYVGFEGGHVLKSQAGTILSEENEYARFAAKLHGQIDLIYPRTNAKGNKEIGTRFALTADYFFRQELTGSQHDFNFVEVSPILYLDRDQHVSVGLSYKNGKTTPKFSKVDELNLWVGIKF